MATTKKKYVQHNRQCFACGQEKSPVQLGYDIKTMKTYCLKKCKAPKQIPNVELVPASNEDLLSAIVENYSKEVELAFMAALGKTVSTRLRPAQIMHVLKIAEMEECVSIQATLLNIIDNDMEVRNMDHIELEGYGAEREEDETYEELEQYEEVAKEIGEMPVEHTSEEVRNALDEIREQQERRKKLQGTKWNQEPIKAVINEKPVEPEEEDDEFEI